MKISNKFNLGFHRLVIHHYSDPQNFSIIKPLSCKPTVKFKRNIMYTNSATLSISKAILPRPIYEKSKLGGTKKNLTFKKTFAFANAKIKSSQKYLPHKFNKARVGKRERFPVDPAWTASNSKKNTKENISCQSKGNIVLCQSFGPNNLFWGVLLFSRGDLNFVDLRGVLSSLLKALHACLFATLNNKRILFVADQTPLVQEHQQKLLCFFIGSQAKSFSTKVTDKLPFETLKEKNPYFELSSDQNSNTPNNFGAQKVNIYSENNLKSKLARSKKITNFNKQSNKVENHFSVLAHTASPQVVQTQAQISKLKLSTVKHMYHMNQKRSSGIISLTHSFLLAVPGKRVTDSFSPILSKGRSTLLWGYLLSTSFLNNLTHNMYNYGINPGLKISKNQPILKDWLLSHSPDLLVKAHDNLELKTSESISRVRMLSHIVLPFRNLFLEGNAKQPHSEISIKQHRQSSAGSVKLYSKNLVTSCVTLPTETLENTSLIPDPLFSRQVVKLIGKANVRSSQWTFTLAQPTNQWVSGFFSNSFASYKQKLSSATLLGINISDALNLAFDQKPIVPNLKHHKFNLQEKQIVNEKILSEIVSTDLVMSPKNVANFKNIGCVKKEKISDIQDHTEFNLYNTESRKVIFPYQSKPESRYVKVLENKPVNIKHPNIWLHSTNSNVSKQSKAPILKSGQLIYVLLSQKRQTMSKNFSHPNIIYDELNKYAGGQEWDSIFYNPASRKDFVNKLEPVKSNMYKRKKRLKSYTSNLSHKATDQFMNLFTQLTNAKSLYNRNHQCATELSKKTDFVSRHPGPGIVKANNSGVYRFKKIKLYSKLLHHSIKCADAATRNPWLKEADLVFFANPEKTMSLLNQISRLKIPTIGIVNPGSMLSKASFKSIQSYRILSGKPTITYPIIGNANSLNFLRLILTKLANIINR